MPHPPETARRRHVRRGLTEIACILFLFYANLLMGEFTRANGPGKSIAVALRDIVTPATMAIGLGAAVIGYLFFDFLRRNA